MLRLCYLSLCFPLQGINYEQEKKEEEEEEDEERGRKTTGVV